MDFLKTIRDFKFRFSAVEWRLIQVLFIITIISAILFFFPFRKKGGDDIIINPAEGGKYVEGIVADKETAIFENLKRLTNCGFFYFDENHHLQADLVESYEISEDKLTYAFRLRPAFQAEEIKTIIDEQDGFWRDMEIQSENSNIIKIALKQPFGPLLSYLTAPIFPHGPYKIKKQDQDKIVLIRREDYHREKPFLESIEIILYSDANGLLNDLNSGKIMGGGFLDGESIGIQKKTLKKYLMEMPRYYTLFFNLGRETLQDKNIRKKLALNEPLAEEKSFTLTTSDLPLQKKLAEDLAQKWQEKLNVKIHIEYYDPVKLYKEIIPARNYDLLLFGVDYGAEADPYPFWHSTQATSLGMNLSNFRNIEADKILEGARKTFSDKERAEKYQEFRRIWNDEVPAIQIMQSTYEYYVSEKVKGILIREGSSVSDRFNFINRWYIKER